MAVNWVDFVSAIQKQQRFLLISHVRPDCDSLGSQLGMAAVLEALGKEVRIVNGDPIPPNLAFIDPQNRVEVLGQGVTLEDLQDIDAILILDTSAWGQLGPMGDVIRSLDIPKMVLDHHVSEDDLGAQLFKDPKAEATGRLVVEAAGQLGVELTPEMGVPLFAALATDTGWFRFNSVTEGTYACAAQLLGVGVKPAEVYRELYERDTLPRLKLRGVALEHISVEKEGLLAHTYLRQEDFTSTGALLSDTEDVVNRLLSVGGIEVALLFLELDSEKTKVSLRSRTDVDVRAVAAQFGGGGHTAAAGVRFAGSLTEATTAVLDAMREAMG